MTESMPIASNQRRGGAHKLRSVGFSGGPEILVLRNPEYNKDLTICEPGEEGHICVRGECVTHGYEFHESHMNEDPNIKAITKDGFLCTGDKGFVDSDGHLVISGRFKEIINRAGEKISPMEVEDVLMTHPSIKNMICFSAPHRQLTEVVGAAVVLHEGKTLELQHLRSFALERGIMAQWLPETMVTMNAIPKGMTGKPARIKLAEKLQLPEITYSDNFVCWNAFVSAKGDVSAASPAQPNVKQYRPSSSDRHLRRLRLSEPLGLNRESWLGVLMAYLMPALSSEAALILGLPVDDLSDDVSLNNIPFDSISVKRFQERIRRVLGVRVPLNDLMDHSVTSLAKSIASRRLVSMPSNDQIPYDNRVEKESSDESAKFEMLPMQQIYWVGRQGDTPQPAWIEWETVMPDLDEARFEAAVNKLIIRHGALRTFTSPSEPMQQIESPRSAGKFKLVVDSSAIDTVEAIEKCRQTFVTRFQLSQRSFQITALRFGAFGTFRIFFLFDLLVVDARALTVLMDELWALYNCVEKRLPSLTLTVPKYVALVRQRQNDAVQKQEEKHFWAKLCDREPEDGGFPRIRSCRLAANPEYSTLSRLSSSLQANKWRRVTSLCRAEGITESMLLFACYTSILATWSSSKKFTMNCALFGRTAEMHADAARLVGNLSQRFSSQLTPLAKLPQHCVTSPEPCKRQFCVQLIIACAHLATI